MAALTGTQKAVTIARAGCARAGITRAGVAPLQTTNLAGTSSTGDYLRDRDTDFNTKTTAATAVQR